MKPYLLAILFLSLTFVAKAQQNLYFTDYPDVPPADGYRSGYVVTLKGDTLWGTLRNTESVGRILTPDGIYTRLLNIQIKNYGAITKIAFQPLHGELQKLSPSDIKAFSYSASWLEQQIVEVESQYNRNGFIKSTALKKAFSLRDPYEAARLLQRTVYDQMASYESWYVRNLHATCFLQRLAEGKINLYYDNRFDRFYLTKSDNRTNLIYVDYNDPNFFGSVFGDAKVIADAVEHAPEMRKQENFLRVVGLYNLDGSSDLQSKPDEVLLANGEVLRGKLDLKGSSNLTFGIVTRALLTDPEGKKTELVGDEINRITKYVNTQPVIFDALSINNSKKMFYQRFISGKVNVYYDPRTVITYLQKKDGDIQTHYQSYVVAKNGQPVQITSKNYGEQLKSLFSDKPDFVNSLATQPDRGDFAHFIDLVKAYNQY